MYCRELPNASENQNSTVLNNMPHTGDQTSYVVSSHSKNYLDSYRGSPAHTTISMASVTGINAMPISTSLTTQTPLMKSQLNINQPHLQQLLSGSLKNPLQLQINDVATTQNQNVERYQLQPQEVHNSIIQMHSNAQKGHQLTQLQATPMSSILRAQLEELKQLPQPLGTSLLTSNEQHLCKIFNLAPTTYLSLKALLLSGAPIAPNNMSPVENSLRKYFIKVGWLSH